MQSNTASNWHDDYTDWKIWQPEQVLLRPVAELWNHLPIYYYLYVIAVMNMAALCYFPEPRTRYLLSGLFPLTVVLGSYWGRLTGEGLTGAARTRRFALFAVGALAFLGAVIAYGLTRGFIALGEPLAHIDQVKWNHEITSSVWTIAITAHCYWRKDLWGFLTFYGTAFLYGMILETSGVTMGYFFEPCYHLYIPPFTAPAVTMFGWSTVFYPAVAHMTYWRTWFKPLWGESIVRPALMVTAVAICIDLVVDPVASNIGLWTWHEVYKPELGDVFIFDVPFLNFSAWFGAVFAFGLGYFYCTQWRSEWTPKQAFTRNALLLPFVYALSGTIHMPLMLAVETFTNQGGFPGPTINILWEYNKNMSKGIRHEMLHPELGSPLCAPPWVREWQAEVDAQKPK
jgi:hypothetical protein